MPHLVRVAVAIAFGLAVAGLSVAQGSRGLSPSAGKTVAAEKGSSLILADGFEAIPNRPRIAHAGSSANVAPAFRCNSPGICPRTRMAIR